MSKTNNALNIGLITGGGDCPGLNNAIAGLIKASLPDNRVIGFYRSWNGLIENQFIPMDASMIDEISHQGGTILKSAKSFPLNSQDKLDNITKTIKEHALDVLVIIGGDSTLYVAKQIHEKLGIPIMGIPKTIDNDIPHNDFSIGFVSAVETVCQSIEQVKTSAKSHSRAMVIEVMGRHTGHLTAYAGLASNCDIILVPEHPVRLDQLKQNILKRFEGQKKYLLIAVAEGAILLDENDKPIQIFEQDESFKGMSAKGGIRYGGIADYISDWMNDFVDWDARSLVLGHLQRGGAASAMDRILAFSLAAKAAELIKQKQFNQILGFKQGNIIHTSFDEVFADNQEQQKTLPEEFYQLCILNTD
ncbi:MAG TPA: ATP-dependent 6-phosphofructokinase [Oligoflexia bacterium]|nr:ATP-dependent 6-phosphofructokinase [Oligoflexia bacterium]HMR25225.1 ATP-dependent 6-phosphofructokinase [Oligoflexia bacterium]